MKKIIVNLILFVFVAVTAALAQDTKQVIGELAQVYGGMDPSKGGLIGGFSMAGLVGTVIFNGIGFIAFAYGKKNSEIRPLLIGIALMGYPYFVRSTLAIYAVGVGLSAALYFFRE